MKVYPPPVHGPDRCKCPTCQMHKCEEENHEHMFEFSGFVHCVLCRQGLQATVRQLMRTRGHILCPSCVKKRGAKPKAGK